MFCRIRSRHAERTEIKKANHALRHGNILEAQSHYNTAAVIHNQSIDNKINHLQGKLNRAVVHGKMRKSHKIQNKILQAQSSKFNNNGYIIANNQLAPVAVINPVMMASPYIIPTATIATIPQQQPQQQFQTIAIPLQQQQIQPSMSNNLNSPPPYSQTPVLVYPVTGPQS